MWMAVSQLSDRSCPILGMDFHSGFAQDFHSAKSLISQSRNAQTWLAFQCGAFLQSWSCDSREKTIARRIASLFFDSVYAS